MEYTIKAVGSSCIDLLLPPRCAGCRRALGPVCGADALANVLCDRCRTALIRLPGDGCALCQEPKRLGPGSVYCGGCAGSRPALESCHASVAFEGRAESWIRAFKYPARGIAALRPEAESVVGALVCDATKQLNGPLPGAVVPIPLHPNRLRERGFNPAALLAARIAHEIGRPLETRALTRVRDTPSQTHLGRRARRRNVKGAFSAGPLRAEVLWLVDDVVTTGSTLQEAARTLQSAGAKEVHAVCVARTPG